MDHYIIQLGAEGTRLKPAGRYPLAGHRAPQVKKANQSPYQARSGDYVLNLKCYRSTAARNGTVHTQIPMPTY